MVRDVRVGIAGRRELFDALRAEVLRLKPDGRLGYSEAGMLEQLGYIQEELDLTEMGRDARKEREASADTGPGRA